jgi:hypothetical protein
MKTMPLTVTFLLALPAAHAQQDGAQTKTQAPPAAEARPAPQAPEPGKNVDEMQQAQQALEAIVAAQQALAKHDRDAARERLDEAERRLEPLYDTPPLAALLNELEEAIGTAQGSRPMDLAPLAGVAREQRIYIEPEAYADIAQAEKFARDRQLDAAAEKLRAARQRIGVSVAFLPVEEAYVRVLAARALLTTGDTDDAARILGTLPVIMEDVRLSAPLVPVRFDLQAAAAAAEEKNWTRAGTLLLTARTRIDGVLAASPPAELQKTLRTVRSDIDRLHRQVVGEGRKPAPGKIRDLAQRVRDASLG